MSEHVYYQWSVADVNQWLITLNLENYTPVFTERQITGPFLLHLDSSQLKVSPICSFIDRLNLFTNHVLFSHFSVSVSVSLNQSMGVTNSNDRALLKKKIKELKLDIERDRKAIEKEQKIKVKQLKKEDKLKRK